MGPRGGRICHLPKRSIEQTKHGSSLTSPSDAAAEAVLPVVVSGDLEDVGLDDLAVAQVRLQPHLVPRLGPQAAQHHTWMGKKHVVFI